MNRTVFNIGIIFLTLVVCLAVLQQCITPLETIPEEEREILVIEGGITNKPGPHLIEISKSARYGSRAVGEIERIINATVRIRADNGDQVFLEAGKSGEYWTPSTFQGVVGAKYTLLVILEDGERYASLPEEMVVPVEIQEIIPEFKELPALDEFNGIVGVELFSKFQDPPNERNFYFWQLNGEFEFYTRPDLYRVPDGMGGEIILPKDCCEICFAKEAGAAQELSLFTDIFTNGNLHQEPVGFIIDDGLRFLATYMAVVQQFTITKDAYAFLELLESQTQIDGDIFDPPPATLRGNILNLDEPDEATIGYFYAASVAVDTVFIERSLLTNPAPIRNVRDDCRVLFDSTATTVIPPYWPG